MEGEESEAERRTREEVKVSVTTREQATKR